MAFLGFSMVFSRVFYGFFLGISMPFLCFFSKKTPLPGLTGFRLGCLLELLQVPVSKQQQQLETLDVFPFKEKAGN